MNWLTSTSFVVILLLAQQTYVESRKSGFGTVSKSPWANKVKANTFMQCLIQNIATSSVFPQQEKEDMESIVETMMSAISSMNRGGNNQAQMQAMNMAFASSMAELVIAEDAGNMQAIAVKANALSETLKTCFRSVMGTINNQFINEIKDLIQMFAKQAAEEENIEEIATVDTTSISPGSQATSTYKMGADKQTDNFGFTAAYRADSRDTQYGVNAVNAVDFGVNGEYGVGDNSRTPNFGQFAPGYGDTGATGPSAAGDLSGITNSLASALASSTTFKSIFRAGVASQVTARIATSALQSCLSSNLRVDASASLRIQNDLQGAILSLGAGADVNAYAMAVAKTVVSGLSSSGQLNADNASDLGVNFASGFLQASAAVAAQYGIRISQADVSSDIRTVTNVIRTSTSKTTSVSTSVSSVGQSSLDFGASSLLEFRTPSMGNAGSSPKNNLIWLLSSPSGLSSPSASNRIQSFTSLLMNSLSSGNFDAKNFAKYLAQISYQTSTSGLSDSDAKIETLLEAIVSLVQILSSSQIGNVDLSSTTSLSRSIASNLASVLVGLS